MEMPATSGTRNRRYEWYVLLLLTLANGVVAFDRLTVSYLSPYIVADMGLSNADLGLIAAALSGAIGISAFLGGRLADSTGKRKLLLIVCTVIFSIASGAGGLAMTLGVLLLARFVLGLAEGPIVPIGQSIIAETAAPERRGVSMGVMQMVGGFGIAGILGPWVATHLAEDFGWRVTMMLSVIPGLLLALGFVFILKKDPPRPVAPRLNTPADSAAAPTADADKIGAWKAITLLIAIPNIRIVLFVAAMFTAWLVLQNTFLALFLTKDKGLDPVTAGSVIAMGGIAGIAGGVGLPFLSDRVGRKPVMVFGALAGVCGPIALLLLDGNAMLLGLAVLLGWLPIGIGPLYCATVPIESVPPALVTTAIGLAMGTAELFGGVILPPIAGRLADSFGLAVVFYICIALAIGAAIAGLFLKETAPAKINRSTVMLD